jgi:DNA-binding transcriptional ArsR family regulator
VIRARHPARRDTPDVDIRASAPCEFVLYLSECSSPSVYASTTLGKAWFDEIRAGVDSDFLAAIDAFTDAAPGAPVQLWSRLVPLANETPAPHDVSAFLSHFGAIPPLHVRRTLLGYHALPPQRMASPELLYQAAQGDEAAIREVASTHFPADPARAGALVELLVSGLETTRAHLLAIMQRFYDEVYRNLEATIQPILERDAQAARGLSRTLPLGQLVETVTNGIEFQPWPGLEWVTLLPSYVIRPWTVQLYHEAGMLFCYPVAEDSLVEASEGPPARLVQLHQALGDERRLRILRYLAVERATFQEVANALDLPKSSLHYHVSILRSAGLLRVGAGERGNVYSLRREALDGMAEALLDYFESGAESPALPQP